MKSHRSALCALCLVLLIPLLARAWRVLPLDNRPLVAEKYAGWSGVLRLWVYEGWQPGSGSLAGWLNRCIARFERRHPGVYIQPQSVDIGAISEFRDSGILPPDMLLFPPGALDGPAGLCPLSTPDALRPELARCGAWGNSCFAVPVAMGGYAWAWNAALVDGVPASWRDCDATLAVPEPEAWRRWDAALLALCAGRRADGPAPQAPEAALPDVDLGLAAAMTPEPASTPAPQSGGVCCRLPADFAFDADAWRRFANGEAAAMPVTQREVRRLQALSDQGRGPDWRLSVGGAAFTDQLLCLALVEKADADEPRALCRAFMDWLIGDECQGALCEAGAFTVTGAAGRWEAGDPLARMDAALQQQGLVAPGCFDGEWPEFAKNIVRKFIDDDGESDALWRALAGRLSENPNIIS